MPSAFKELNRLPKVLFNEKCQISRLIEERVADSEGTTNVRHWLETIARGREEESIDLGTVKGYNSIACFQMIRDEVEFNLGRLKVEELLMAMCNGRLLPTNWLNKVEYINNLANNRYSIQRNIPPSGFFFFKIFENLTKIFACILISCTFLI